MENVGQLLQPNANSEDNRYVLESQQAEQLASSSASALIKEEHETANKGGSTEMSNTITSNSEGLCTVQLEKPVFDRWCQVKEAKGFHSDSTMACLLLKWYDSQQQSQWCVECVYCQALLSVSLACGKPGHTDATQYLTTTQTADATSISRTKPATDFSCDTMVQMKGQTPCDVLQNVHCKVIGVRLTSAKNESISEEHSAQEISLGQGNSDGDVDNDYTDGDTDIESLIEEKKITQNSSHFTCSKKVVSGTEGSAADRVGRGERERQQFKCEQCGEICSSSKALSVHSDKMHSDKQDSQTVKYTVTDGDEGTLFECTVCKKSFASKIGVLSHFRVHRNDKPFCCQFCQKRFRSLAYLQTHKLKMHGAIKPYSSDQCDAAYGIELDLSNLKRTQGEESLHNCPDCGLNFKTASFLSSHWKQAHVSSVHREGKGFYRCEVCEKSFKFKRTLTLHMKSHISANSSLQSQVQQEASQDTLQRDDTSADKKLIEPSEDMETCVPENLLQEQILANKTEKLFICNICEKRYKSRKGLYEHKIKEHSKEWPRDHKCDKCDSVFRFKTQLTEHKRSHKDERPFSCGQCGARFKSSANLRRHKSWHDDMCSSVCHLCGKSCLGLKSLTRHIKMQHGSEHMMEKPHKCTECTATFSSLSKLTAHAGVHSHQHNCVCSECGQAFRSAHILTIHMRRHTGEKPFKCSECEESFIDKSTLKRHQLQHMSKSTELCHVCGAGFQSKAHLALHVQRHTVERPFKCMHCDKAYKTTGDLKSHMLSHSDDRPFPCSHCSYAARTKAMLNKHVRKHTGERPYRCKQCSASFTYFSCLSAHRRLHSNTKPYVCEVCKAAFFTTYNLQLHSRKHSGERPYQCPHCPERFSWHSGLKCHLKKHQSRSEPEVPVTEMPA